MKFSNYTVKIVTQVLADLKTSESGLRDAEARRRLAEGGPNEISARETGPFDILLRQFKSPFFYLLLAAGLVALVIGEIVDGLVIFSFIALNTGLGFMQESKAERAVALLKKYIPTRVRIMRQGAEKFVDKRELVHGDIVMLEAGDVVPADLRLVRAQNFLIDESVLTGESAPVSKNPEPLERETREIFAASNIIFGGTSVVSGEATGAVIGTGRSSAMGEIAKLVAGVNRESAYEKYILKFSRFILKIIVATIVLIFVANLIIKGGANNLEFLIFCIALIVSIIPEALPVVVTFALSHGSLEMAKDKVVVKRLSAIEDMGDIEVLCTDKTGTLTENKLELVDIHSPDRERCLLYGLLGSPLAEDSKKSLFNPFDQGIFENAPAGVRQAIKKFKFLAKLPFDFARLRNSALFANNGGGNLLIVRGAPEAILSLCTKFENHNTRRISLEEIKEDEKAGNRTLAIGYKIVDRDDYTTEDENGLTFLGYVSFHDPLKETARESIRLADKLGVKIKILTGDSKEVAGAVGCEVGLIDDPSKVILGETIDSLKNSKLEKACREFSVFARISPETKYKIIRTLQKDYEVGFLGEGINDAPALKIANVAIAVKDAADVSREAADIVLLKKDLRVIVNGIRHGRNIFSNINKYIKCTLASNFGNFYSIAAISLFIPYLPMLPVQILLANLLSDFPLISVATDKVDVEELRKPKSSPIGQAMTLIIFLAMVSTIFDFIFFGLFNKLGPELLRTLWFIESILTEIVLIFSIRTRHFFLRAAPPSRSVALLAILSAAITIILPFTGAGHDLFHFAAPPVQPLMIVFGMIIAYLILSEIIKLIYYKYMPFNGNHAKKAA
ncbi:MAG: HAD-IC family P-type ATPase [Patescibacteria group bacterium]|nr:HAD-IC family P-type ATPase [Patescibacteria group bacterium]